jgi:hypothetical protein
MPTTDYHGMLKEEMATISRGKPRQKKQTDKRGG